MKKVYITRKLAGSAEKILRERKFSVKVFKEDHPVSRAELLKESKDADALITLLTDKIDRGVIDNLTKCKIIANCAVGINNIDVDYARSKHIIVTNTPGILTDATADLTVALILACARRLREGELLIRSGGFTSWKPQMLLGLEMKGKTVGIIGAGRIGTATALRLRPFGTNFIYYDRNKREVFDEKLGGKKVSLNELMKSADIISVHLPLGKDTFHLLNKNNLSLVKKSAVIVNTSRGEIIDETALIRQLKSKKIFAAGLDVYENEPDVNPEFFGLDNVYLLPHIGSATIETRSGMAELCANNVIQALQKKKPITPVY